jgi:hypothetical protein
MDWLPPVCSIDPNLLTASEGFTSSCLNAEGVADLSTTASSPTSPPFQDARSAKAV